MRSNSAIRGLAASLTIAAVAALLCACPKQTEAPAGTGQDGAAGGQTAGQDAGAGGGGESAAPGGPPAGEPSSADYISGKAGTEVVNTADGQSLPQGWPLPSLLPPPGSTLLEGGEGRKPWVPGSVYWRQPFSTELTWPQVTEHIETELRNSGFQLVRGEDTPEEPKLDAAGAPAAGFTKGERRYRSPDGRTLVFLKAQLRTAPERPGDPLARYELQISILDVAPELPASTSLEDL